VWFYYRSTGGTNVFVLLAYSSVVSLSQILAGATEILDESVFRKAMLPALEPLFASPDWSAEVLALALATQNNFKVRR
jgi:hypothetical protein